MKTDKLLQAESTVARCEADFRKREAELEEALAAESAAMIAYDTSEAETDQKKAVGARVRRESKERHLAHARETLDRARKDLASLEHERQETEHANEHRALLDWPDGLSKPIERVLALEAQIDAEIRTGYRTSGASPARRARAGANWLRRT
jgi:hypothetical protein